MVPILSEPVTAFICASIASDGHVGPCIDVMNTADKNRGIEVRNILLDVGLIARINKSGKSRPSGKQNWVVRLLKRGGQWYTLFWSIKHWKMENWLGQRKFQDLENLVGLSNQKTLKGV